MRQNQGKEEVAFIETGRSRLGVLAYFQKPCQVFFKLFYATDEFSCGAVVWVAEAAPFGGGWGEARRGVSVSVPVPARLTRVARAIIRNTVGQ